MKTLTNGVKFGRRRPTPESIAAAPHLHRYLTSPVALPTPPEAFDYAPAAGACLSQIMGNEQYGDCTCAGAGHALGLWTGNAGALVTLTTDQVLAIYSAVTGFNPADPFTDQGANEIDVLNYLMTTGFPDGSRLAGYCIIDGTNPAMIQLGAWLSECLYFGVELPDAWISPFPSASGFTWDVGTPDPENGHCFVGTGCPTAAGVSIDTWGMLGTITYAAISALTSSTEGGELYALFSEAALNKASQKAPNGFDWAQLQADFETIRASTRGGLTK